MVESDGSVSKTVALETFAAEIAPLPGVKVPRGPIGYVPDGTAAIYQAIAYWPQLSHAQRRAILKVIGKLVHPARRGDSARAAALPDANGANSLVNRYAREYEAIFGKPDEQISLTRAPLVSDWNLAAGSLILSDNYLPLPRRTPRRCVIVLNTIGPLAADGKQAETEQVLAHEVFHCFQAHFAGTIGDWAAALADSNWLVDGGANYAACTLVPKPDDFVGPWVTGYHESPEKPLFERKYDGVGFFDHLADALGMNQQSTLLLMPPMMLRSGALAAAGNALAANTEAYRVGVSQGQESAVLGTSASTFFADRTLLGAGGMNVWLEEDSCSDPDGGQAVPANVNISTGSQQVSTKPLANGMFDLTSDAASSAKVSELRVQVTHGYVRIGGGANKVNDLLGADSPLGATRTYCLQAGGCICPSGTSASAPPTEAQLELGGAPPPHLALSGDLDGGMATITGYQLKCDQPASLTVNVVGAQPGYPQFVFEVEGAEELPNGEPKSIEPAVCPPHCEYHFQGPFEGAIKSVSNEPGAPTVKGAPEHPDYAEYFAKWGFPYDVTSITGCKPAPYNPGQTPLEYPEPEPQPGAHGVSVNRWFYPLSSWPCQISVGTQPVTVTVTLRYNPWLALIGEGSGNQQLSLGPPGASLEEPEDMAEGSFAMRDAFGGAFGSRGCGASSLIGAPACALHLAAGPVTISATDSSPSIVGGSYFAGYGGECDGQGEPPVDLSGAIHNCEIALSSDTQVAVKFKPACTGEPYCEPIKTLIPNPLPPGIG